ncbi:hypothetical protein GJ496_003878 [Pomphorhynchus laevis]|nr:hypothetical protein GJ496_003878 [Pomphorhynchus laevis]
MASIIFDDIPGNSLAFEPFESQWEDPQEKTEDDELAEISKCFSSEDPAFNQIQSRLNKILKQKIEEVRACLITAKQELNHVLKEKEGVGLELYECQRDVQQIAAIMRNVDKYISEKEKQIQTAESIMEEYNTYYNQSIEACKLSVEATIPAKWYEERQLLESLKISKTEIYNRDKVTSIELERTKKMLKDLIKQHEEMCKFKSLIMEELEGINIATAEYHLLMDYQDDYENSFNHDSAKVRAQNDFLRTEVKRAYKMHEMSLNSLYERIKQRHKLQTSQKSIDKDISLKSAEYANSQRLVSPIISQIKETTADINGLDRELDLISHSIDLESGKKFELEQNIIMAKEKLTTLSNSKKQAEKVCTEVTDGYTRMKNDLVSTELNNSKIQDKLKQIIIQHNFDEKTLAKLNKILQNLEENSKSKQHYEDVIAEIENIQIDKIQCEGQMRSLQKREKELNEIYTNKECQVNKMKLALKETQSEYDTMREELNLAIEKFTSPKLNQQELNIKDLSIKCDEIATVLEFNEDLLKSTELDLLNVDSKSIELKQKLVLLRNEREKLAADLENAFAYSIRLKDMIRQEDIKLRDFEKSIENYHRTLQKYQQLHKQILDHQTEIRRSIENREDKGYIEAMERLEYILKTRQSEWKLEQELEIAVKDCEQSRNEVAVWKDKDKYIVGVKKAIDENFGSEIKSLEDLLKQLNRRIGCIEIAKSSMVKQIELCVERRLDAITRRELYSPRKHWQKWMLNLDISRVEKNYRNLFNHKLRLLRSVKESKLHILNMSQKRFVVDEYNLELEKQLSNMRSKSGKFLENEIIMVQKKLNIMQRKELTLENIVRLCDPVKIRSQVNVTKLQYKRCKEWLVIIMKCLAEMKNVSHVLPFDEFKMYKSIEDHFANADVRTSFFAAVNAFAPEPDDIHSYFLDPTPIIDEFKTDVMYAPLFNTSSDNTK